MDKVLCTRTCFLRPPAAVSPFPATSPPSQALPLLAGHHHPGRPSTAGAHLPQGNTQHHCACDVRPLPCPGPSPLPHGTTAPQAPEAFKATVYQVQRGDIPKKGALAPTQKQSVSATTPAGKQTLCKHTGIRANQAIDVPLPLPPPAVLVTGPPEVPGSSSAPGPAPVPVQVPDSAPPAAVSRQTWSTGSCDSDQPAAPKDVWSSESEVPPALSPVAEEDLAGAGASRKSSPAASPDKGAQAPTDSSVRQAPPAPGNPVRQAPLDSPVRQASLDSPVRQASPPEVRTSGAH